MDYLSGVMNFGGLPDERRFWESQMPEPANHLNGKYFIIIAKIELIFLKNGFSFNSSRMKGGQL
jgi:hypothetical protein